MTEQEINIYKRKYKRPKGRKKFYISKNYKFVNAMTYKDGDHKIKLKNKKLSVTANRILLSELCEQWLELKKQDIKESTYIKYRNIILNQINPRLGNSYINRLRSEDMQKYVQSLKKQNLSNKSIKDTLTLISAILKYAEKAKLYTNNLNIEDLYPKVEKKQIQVLTTDERIRLERYLLNSNDPAKYEILLALYSGMRIGEICALKWSNIDLDKETISVCFTLQHLQDRENQGKTKIIISEPKSQSSKRFIPIPAFMTELFNDIKPISSSTFFLTGHKHFMEPRSLENKFKNCLRECNIEYINFHSLRHTFATHCIEVGFDVKSLSEILGHSSVGTTLNLYAHPTLEYKRSTKCLPFGTSLL